MGNTLFDIDYNDTAKVLDKLWHLLSQEHFTQACDTLNRNAASHYQRLSQDPIYLNRSFKYHNDSELTMLIRAYWMSFYLGDTYTHPKTLESEGRIYKEMEKYLYTLSQSQTKIQFSTDFVPNVGHILNEIQITREDIRTSLAQIMMNHRITYFAKLIINEYGHVTNLGQYVGTKRLYEELSKRDFPISQVKLFHNKIHAIVGVSP